MPDSTAAPAMGMGWATALSRAWEGLSSVAGKIAAPVRAAGAAMGLTGAAAKDAGDKAGGLANSGLLVAAAFALATSKLLGWVTAGLAGTTAGERLADSTQRMKMQFASVFLPAIEAVTAKIQQLTAWFANLTGEQQRSIARWTGLTLGMMGAVALLPKLIGGLSSLSGVLTGTLAANPFLAVIAGIVTLMSRTEEGRASLSELAGGLASAFGAVADILGAVLIPIIEAFTDVLSKPIGKVALFGTLFVGAAFKIIGAFASMKTAAMLTGGAITLFIGGALTIAAALFSSLTSKVKEFSKESADLAGQVKRGGITEQEARQEIKNRAAEKAAAEQEERRGSIGYKADKLFGRDVEKNEEERRQKRQDKFEKEGLAAFDRVLGKLGGRSDLTSSKTQLESPADAIKRIEQAALKTDDAPKRAADYLDEIRKMMEAGLKGLLTPPEKDNKERPPRLP